MPLRVKAVGQVIVGLKLHAPSSLRPGDVFNVDFVMRDEELQSVVGGIAAEVHIAKEQ